MGHKQVTIWVYDKGPEDREGGPFLPLVGRPSGLARIVVGGQTLNLGGYTEDAAKAAIDRWNFEQEETEREEAAAAEAARRASDELNLDAVAPRGSLPDEGDPLSVEEALAALAPADPKPVPVLGVVSRIPSGEVLGAVLASDVVVGRQLPRLHALLAPAEKGQVTTSALSGEDALDALDLLVPGATCYLGRVSASDPRVVRVRPPVLARTVRGTWEPAP